MSMQEFRALSRNWDAFGEADPLFGILSDPTKSGGQWGIDEFYDSGREHVDHVLGVLRGLDVSYRPGVCLDFGCGVGRLTMPLSTRFERTIGVDVAKSMVALARRYDRLGHRCEFVVNRRPDLRMFPDATFDFVHSCLVLQHIPPDIALGYVREFLRVAKPGGLIVFQSTADTFTEEEASLKLALPNKAFAAGIEIRATPGSLRPSESATLRLVVTNASPVRWPHDIPGGRHITVANHWLLPDGTMAAHDDGRARLPRTLGPGECCEVELTVRAPADPGEYRVEIDLVQELICWFAQYGSTTTRAAILVRGAPAQPIVAAPPPPQRLTGRFRALVRRGLRPFRRGTATFEMHLVPRAAIQEAVRAGGGELLHAIEDNAAGHRWLSFTYVCRRI
jgi:SAM-dependent methyltransferase